MNLLLFRHTWGVAGTWEEGFPTFKALGYHGVETGIPEKDQERFQQLLQQHGLELILQVFTQGDSVQAHVESFRRQVEEAQRFHPRVINAHSGQDAWDESESRRFFKRLVPPPTLTPSPSRECR